MIVRVQDTGIGVSAEQAERLFQPFGQADQSIRRKFGGTDLGLFISKKLAKAMGGDLRLETAEPGHGSVFLLTLPCVLDQEETENADLLHMPVMDGFMATQELLRLGFKRPILALTARAQPEDREAALELGFAAYLTKPVNLRHLVSEIQRLTTTPLVQEPKGGVSDGLLAPPSAPPM